MSAYKIKIPRSLILLVALSVTLSILRVVIWGKLSFLYLLWNILLAIAPFIISSLLLSYVKIGKVNKIIFIVGILIWLLFIPNAPYIVTDFLHLGEIRAVPVLFDIFLLFASAMTGLFFGFYSFFHIEEIIKRKYSTQVTYAIMSLIMILISFGMYLGRFLRFNSWDIFANHIYLLQNVWKISNRPEVYFYTLLFFIFIFLSYESWKSLVIKGDYRNN